MMKAIKQRGLEEKVYLWSDDNLSTDLLWKCLNDKDREIISGYKNYGRVGCFKGFDDISFNFNTGAPIEFFNRQFELYNRLLDLKIDLYAYATFTTYSRDKIDEKIKVFIERLQNINENLPLRTVPLKICVFSTVKNRLNSKRIESIDIQKAALEAWKTEIERRFSSDLRSLEISKVPLY